VQPLLLQQEGRAARALLGSRLLLLLLLLLLLQRRGRGRRRGGGGGGLYRVPRRLGQEPPLEDGAVRAARADEQLLVGRGALVLLRVGVGVGVREVLAPGGG